MIEYEKPFTGWRRCRCALALAFLCLLAEVSVTTAVAQATSNAIKITAPSTGTTVTPGQTLQVTVSVAAGTKFGVVQVIGEDIGITPPKQSPPYSFALTIPNNIIGPKKLTAVGIIGPDNGVFSQPVVVDVETPMPLTDLNVTPPRLSFNHVGDHVNFTVMGKFTDGTVLNIRHSSNTSYETNDATVAIVQTQKRAKHRCREDDENNKRRREDEENHDEREHECDDNRITDGVVTAVGVGTTGILVKYGGRLVAVPVSVTETFAGTPGSPNCRGKSVSALAEQYEGLAAAAKALGYPSVQALQEAIRAYCGR